MKKKTVKKIFKITLISLASLVGLALIGVCILLWIVFTPKRLTPIVENFAADYITCDYKIGEVELTFFSTFPQFGLKINEVRLVNHIANAPNDTLLNAQNVVAEINLRELISNNSLIINELTLNDIRLNAFVDTSGRTNFDVIKIEPAPEDDTAAFELPFDKIDLNTLKINDLDIAYCDMVNRINALIPDLDIVCTADLHNDDGNATLSLKGTSVDLQAGDLTASLPDIDLHCEAGLHNDNIEATLSLVGKGIDVIVDTVPYLTQA